MDVSIGSFKIKLFKAPAITNISPPPPTPLAQEKEKQCWSPPGSFLPPTEQDWPEWNEGRGPNGTNPQDRLPVG